MKLEYSEPAEAQTDEIAERLSARYGPQISGRFLDGLTAALEREIAFVQIGRRPLARESQATRRDLYAVVARGGGSWRVLYELRDDDRDGALDTMLVVSVVSATGPDAPAGSG